MRVYLANQYSQKELMKVCTAELRAKGIEVTSTWPEEPHKPETQLHEVGDAVLIEYAYRDLLEIAHADMVVFFSVAPTTPTLRGGRHVEFGYALANRKPILVVGPRENIFHYLREVKQVDTWEDAVYYLLRKARRRT
jgi:nucleoside 2-deoxyribosyltransferase